ncbi:MAG TPA: RibD family protein, partial [Nitrospira sp.]
SELRIPPKSKILSDQRFSRTLIATTPSASAARMHALHKMGVETLVVPSVKGKVSLPALLKELGRRGITSVLVEGGSEINASMLKAKLVHHVRLYLAPSLLGGADAKGVIGGKSPSRLTQGLKLKHVRVRSVGGDVVVEGDL